MDEFVLFLRGEFWVLTTQAGLCTRNHAWPVFNQNITKTQKSEFKLFLRQLIEEFTLQYNEHQIDAQTHVSNMQELIKIINQEYGRFLFNKKMRFGVLQKLFNLHLKYQWSIENILEPPHCPVDNRIQLGLPGGVQYHWTESDSVLEYSAVIMRIHGAADAQEVSIAAWELQNFERA